MLAALLLTAGLVVRLSVSLTSLSPTARDEAGTSGELALTSNAKGIPLFVAETLAPGEVAATCVKVAVDSPVDPEPVTLHVEGPAAPGPLTRHVILTVEEGARLHDDATTAEAAARDCAGFRTEHHLSEGPLADALAGPGWSTGSLRPWDPRPGSAAKWYRIGLRLASDAPAGVMGQRIDGLRFVWSTTAATQRAGWVDGSLLLAGSLAEHSLVPLLVMLCTAILFIGVQDRIDRHDPKLATAPISSEPLVFAPSFVVAHGGRDARTPNGQPPG